MPSTSKSASPPAAPDRPVELRFLEELAFDLTNPRSGVGAAKINTEREALDHIVSMFGVNDVLGGCPELT